MSIGRTVITTALAVSTILLAATAGAQSFVERNRNAQGVTPPGEYQGIRNMQDNETTCAINPLLPRNILCAWNSSAGSDDLIGGLAIATLAGPLFILVLVAYYIFTLLYSFSLKRRAIIDAALSDEVSNLCFKPAGEW